MVNINGYYMVNDGENHGNFHGPENWMIMMVIYIYINIYIYLVVNIWLIWLILVYGFP